MSEYYVQMKLFGWENVDAKYASKRCDTWDVGGCDKSHAKVWDEMAMAMGFTDFVPSTVNYNIPTPWRGSGASRCAASHTRPLRAPDR